MAANSAIGLASATDNRELLRSMIRDRSVHTGGDFTLASGRSSSIFFDMKMTLLSPEGANLAAELILDHLEGMKIDAIGGLIIGACPVADAVAVRSYYRQPINAFYVRKEPKTRGTRKLIEGPIKDGDRVVVVDDVTTTGGSALDAVKSLEDEVKCEVVQVITVVDRDEGAAENFARAGRDFYALFNRSDFVDE